MKRRVGLTARIGAGAVVAIACLFAHCGRAMAGPAATTGAYAGPQGGMYVEAEGGSGAGAVAPAAGASGGSYLTDLAAGQVRSIPFDLPSAIAGAQVYLRYGLASQDSDVPGEISITLIVPPGDGEEPIILPTFLLSPTRGLTDWHWEVTDAGDLTPGHYEMQISQSSPKPIAIDVIGFFPTINDGAWNPPNTVVDGALLGGGGDIDPLSFGVLATGPNGAGSSNSTPGRDLTLSFPLRNRALTHDVQASVSGEIDDENAPIMILPAQAVDLSGGSSGELTYLIPPPGAGSYTVRLTVSGDGRPPRKIVDTFQVADTLAHGSPKSHRAAPAPKKHTQDDAAGQ